MRSSFRAVLAGAAALSPFAAPALASDMAELRIEDTITVTGTRAERAAERQPLRIDAVSRDQIELENIATLAEALETLPGVAMVQGGPAGSQGSLFSRGTNSQHTLALFDGIRLNDPSAPAGAFDFGQDLLGEVERVEVARGPLSSLYGSDAIGGVVNLIPRLGADKPFSPYTEVSVGEFSTVRGLAGAAGSTERARYNVTAEAMTTDGFDVTPARMATATGDRDGAESLSVTAVGEYDLDHGITLSGLFRHRSTTAEFDTFSGGPGFGQRADDPDLEIESDYTVWRLGAGWAASDGSFTSTIRGGQVESDRVSRDGAGTFDAYSGERTFAEWLNVWTPAVDGLADPSVSFGAQFERDGLANDPEFSDPLNESEESFGVYALGTAGVIAGLDVTVAGRIDDYDGFGTQGTWNAGAVYAIAETGIQLFASYGTAFKAPTLSERFSASAWVAPNPDLVPEESESWEIGARGAFALMDRPGALRVGASYYETEIENLIESVFDAETFLSQNRNVGRADISGYELYAEADAVERLTLRVDYAYVDAQNADTGARLQRRPAHSWSAMARWQATGRASLSARYAHVGSRRDVVYDDDGFFVGSGLPVTSYDLVHLAGAFDVNANVQAFASLKNAFNETYEQPAAFAGAPRAVTVGVRARY
jgi:vitamin B12 transporter